MLATNTRLKANKIFNEAGDDSKENRLIWGGNTTNLMQLNGVKYNWATGLYKQMREQFWIPGKVDITQDVNDYKNLTVGERRAYNGILSYLTFLDSIQTCNLPLLKSPITAPEVALCLTEQASQEAMHNDAYQVMIDTIIPAEDRRYVYDFWRTDKVLRERCRFIAAIYQNYLDDPTSENYFIALIADYLLEGIYFYNGFVANYNFASRQLMSGSADVYRLINRDELSHVRLFQKLIPEAMQLFPYSEGQIYEMFDDASRHEIEWTNHIMGGEVLGITEESTKQYTKYLANIRLGAIGLKPLYEGVKNPYKHLEKFADTSGNGETKANFFEATVTSYLMSSGIGGWDKI